MNSYITRIIDEKLDKYLTVFGAVLLVGPKWCGKTTTARQHAKSVIALQDSRESQNYLRLIDLDPSLILDGETPRLIDEWQVAPVLWDAVRSEVDRRKKFGQFILTGSAVPQDLGVRHSGIGRIARLPMGTLSLFESGDSNGEISLGDVFEDKVDIDGVKSDKSIPDLTVCIARGGWPGSIGMNDEDAFLVVENYVNTLCEVDIHRVDGVERNPERVRAILRSYARNISTLSAQTTILRDVVATEGPISDTTFYDYINALERLFVINDVKAWSPAIRSRTAVRTGSKREFTDPSIAVAAMGLNPDSMLADVKTLGFLFESLCIRDLRIYAQALGGRVSFYADRTGLESDAVIHLKDGRYGLIEIKLGGSGIDHGVDNLNKLEALFVAKGQNLPTFKMVLTGTNLAYKQKDGVMIVPVACLKQ